MIRRSVGDFLDRLFGGDPRPLMQFLAEDGRLEAEDLDELRKLIENT